MLASSSISNPLEAWKTLSERCPRIAQILRDIYCIPAASSGVEREFSIAAEYDQDNRGYSTKVLSDLMITQHRIAEQNLEMKKQYYLRCCRVEAVYDDDLEEEVKEMEEALQQSLVLYNALRLQDISDGEDSNEEDFDEDEFVDIEEIEKAREDEADKDRTEEEEGIVETIRVEGSKKAGKRKAVDNTQVDTTRKRRR